LCKQRQERFQALLNTNFVESPGKITDKQSVLNVLELDEHDKGLATRAIHKAFPTASIDRKNKTFRNIRKVTSFELKTDPEEIIPVCGTDLSNIRALLAESRQQNSALLEEIISRVKDGKTENIQALLDAHKKQSDLVTYYSETLDKLYEKEITLLMSEKENPSLSESDKLELVKETQALSNSVNLGLRSGEKSSDVIVKENIFEILVEKVMHECPLLYDIVKTLFPTDNIRKEKGAVHALSLLMSLKNSHCKNDVTLIFTLMLVSYGAGARLVNMLNLIGVTMHWNTLMGFLDKHKKNREIELQSEISLEKPLIVLMDNINIYRGFQKYHRMFNEPLMTMWNFTVRGLLDPSITGIEELFENADTCLKSQEDVTDWTSDNLDIEHNNELQEQWVEFQKRYILCLLNDGLNRIPPHEKPLCAMSESDSHDWLSKADLNKERNNIKIKVADIDTITDTSMSTVKSNVHVLPLSLEDNSTLTGTAAILDQFSSEFNLSSTIENPETLPFNKQKKEFSIKEGRAHAEFALMMSQHKENMTTILEKLQATDIEYKNTFDTNAIDNINGSDDESDDSESEFSTTLTQAQKHFSKCDKMFKELYDNIAAKVEESMYNESVASLIEMLRTMNLSVTDHLGRTLLHVACEHGNVNLASCLLQAGINPNAKEMCGATALVISIIQKNKQLCQLLIHHQACVTGPLFVTIPSPLEIASKMEQTEIIEILNSNDSDSENDDIASYDATFKYGHNVEKNCPEKHSHDRVINRQTPGFLTGVVGDQGTCKTNRGVLARTSAHKWVGIIPGDLHTKGHFCEACFKEQGPGGFHFIVNKIMKRPKLTADAFKKNKFWKGNLCRIREAVADCAKSYGLAAVNEFIESKFYPDANTMSTNFRKNGNHNDVLYNAFMKWVTHRSSNVSFKYYSRMFLYYGPLLEMFDISTSHVLGKVREACYVLQLPTFAQLNFPNYYTESFIHTVNFLGKWPLAFRKLVQLNCAVNLSGHTGKAIELDAYVEAEIVQPMKSYVSGKKMVSVLYFVTMYSQKFIIP
jgi:hypothetical protein